MGPAAFFLRCSHSFHTFSSQKQGAYEHAAAAGNIPPSGDDRNDDDGGDADDAPPPPPLDDVAVDVGVGLAGDLLPALLVGLLRLVVHQSNIDISFLG